MNEMKVFLDKNGTKIKPGDILYREFCVRWRERPGGRRVAINGMSGNESIVSDEGDLLPTEERRRWITRRVEWRGACLVAERLGYSDFQSLMQAQLFDKDGNSIHETTASLDMNSVFDSTVYEIRNNFKGQEYQKSISLSERFKELNLARKIK